MKPVAFFLSCLFCFLMLGIAYFLAVDKLLIVERIVPVPYRQFLLETSSAVGGKVVIDSGSNAIHAFDTQLLSEYFRAPVIITADNGGFPLEYKILNLRRHLKPGDVLILPLEWHYYAAREAFTQSFISHVTQGTQISGYYFTDLSLVEKARFIFKQLPLKSVLESTATFGKAHENYQHVVNRLDQFEQRLESGNNRAYGGDIVESPGAIHFAAAFNSCNDYLFENPMTYGFGKISSTFHANLELLRTLTDAGVTVFFTWPSVVDSKFSACYGDADFYRELEQYTTALVKLVESWGFQFIGTPADSHFTSECFLDTYYHPLYHCARTNTRSLIKALEQASISPLKSSVTPDQLADIIREHIEKSRRSLDEKGY